MDNTSMGAAGPHGDKNEVIAEIRSLMKANPDFDYVRKNLSGAARKKLEGLLQEKRVRDTLRIIDALNRNGLDFAVLKGITLSYFDMGRDFIDLDILVHEKDVETAGAILIREFGYGYGRPAELESLKKGGGNRHDVTLTHPDMLPVEVHYRLFNYMPDGGLSPLSDKAILEMRGVKVPCPRKELQLFEALMHNAFHHMFLCDREKWVKDINTVVSNHDIDWDGFIGMVRGLGHAETAYLTVKMLSGSSRQKIMIPPEALARLSPPSWRCYLKKPVFMWALYFCRDRIFPPKDILEERFRISPESKLFVLTYPANWARLAYVSASMAFKRII